jgi:hypothetical protein
MLYKFSFFIFFILSFNSCFVPQQPYTALPPGPWRGVLQLDPAAGLGGATASEDLQLNFEDITPGELPFNFEVKYESPTKYFIEIKNGEERIRVYSIHIGWYKRLAKDTIRIEFPHKNAYIHGIFQENVIQGDWISYVDDTRIRFFAKNGQNYRFTNLRKTPAADISGNWELSMQNIATGRPETWIATFQQNGNHLVANFKGEMIRPMEGTIQANKLYLSAFDGWNMRLLEAKIQPDGKMIGSFREGKNEPMTWEARRVAE